MPNPDPPLATTPDHIEQTLHSVAQLRADHHGRAPWMQRMLDRVTGHMASTRCLAIVTGVVIAWITVNLTIDVQGGVPFDPPPFVWLASAMALVAFYVVLLIFAAQKREDQLAQHRELLIMELAIVSEQKIAKIIQLLEEARRDNPMIKNRSDAEAEAMAQPADPQTVLGAITEAHAAAPPGLA